MDEKGLESCEFGTSRGLSGKKVILGVCGGIAAYKSVELLRLMIRAGASVRVVMTENARWFVGPGTFQALSRLPVCTSVFEEGDASIRHIDWAQEADLAVIAPATANFLGKLANGIADDALSTFMLAVTAPVVICPAMNSHMYEHPAVRKNLEVLSGFGFTLVEPDAGELACGTTGPGRLPDPLRILEHLDAALADKDMQGVRLLVTAGPTREYLDPVRFISNPSSGKMGFAIARAAWCRGAEVNLVSGPVSLADPSGVRTHRVTTADEMAERVMALLPDSDVVIKAAAVSDYAPEAVSEHKIKKRDDITSLKLTKTLDILQRIGQAKGDRLLVGFAAETRDLTENALKKMEAKNLDLIVGNLIGPESSGFQSDSNQVTLFFRDGRQESLPILDKIEVAHHILDRVLSIRSQVER
ncbi:MAG: bifunctional phosphopantothenoylcysteine decarboxylase/phosphopantothenate--cysteine ligase CoaBC [Desulfobacterales bacterium]